MHKLLATTPRGHCNFFWNATIVRSHRNCLSSMQLLLRLIAIIARVHCCYCSKIIVTIAWTNYSYCSCSLQLLLAHIVTFACARCNYGSSSLQPLLELIASMNRAHCNCESSSLQLWIKLIVTIAGVNYSYW